MTTRLASVTFSPDALWAKSKSFIERALQARDRQDDLEYHLWSAVSLELVGKAALAAANPVLVADPSDFGSLYFAAGGKEPTQKKSIQAKTVFERLALILPSFDTKLRDRCMVIASLRNAELHSGDSPMAGIDQRAWVPAFWGCAFAIVTGQGKTMTDWIGAAEAQRVEELLADASRLLEHTIRARIDRMKLNYDGRLPLGSLERKDAQAHAAARAAPQRIVNEADDIEEVGCPACGSKAWLLGHYDDEDVDGTHTEQIDEDEYETYETVTTHYSADGFRCLECGLILDGHEEMVIAELPLEFTRKSVREITYEDDYGND
jgi:hypothetical protein